MKARVLSWCSSWSGSSWRGLTPFPTHFLTCFVCLFSEGFYLLHCGLSSKLIILFKSLCNAPNPISYKNVWILIANFFPPFLARGRKVQWLGPGGFGSWGWGTSTSSSEWGKSNACQTQSRGTGAQKPSLPYQFVCSFIHSFTHTGFSYHRCQVE